MKRVALISAVLASGVLVGPRLALADDAAGLCVGGSVTMSVPAWLFEAAQEDSVVAPAHPVGSDEVLWCASGLDPRCQPLRTDGDGFFSALAHGLLAPVVVGRATVPRPPVFRVSRYAADGGPRDGARTRLERPPRG